MFRICCVIGLVIVVPRDFGRRANDWRGVTRVPARLLDLGSHCRVGDMLEIPRHQVLYALNSRNGNVQSITRFGWRNSTFGIEQACQRSGIVCDREDGQVSDDIKTFLSSCTVAIAAFINDELRNRKFEAIRSSCPPSSRCALTGCNIWIRVYASGDIANHSCFDVDQFHHAILSSASAHGHPVAANSRWFQLPPDRPLWLTELLAGDFVNRVSCRPALSRSPSRPGRSRIRVDTTTSLAAPRASRTN